MRAPVGLLIVCDSLDSLFVAERAVAGSETMSLGALDDAAMRLELGLVSVALVVSDWCEIRALTRRRRIYAVAGFTRAKDEEWACEALEGGADAYLTASDPDELRALLACSQGLGLPSSLDLL